MTTSEFKSVDLNPIRANIANTPEESDYTSIQQRLKVQSTAKTELPLIPITRAEQKHRHSFSFSLSDYLELVDWVGRVKIEGKRGVIKESVPPILRRLNIREEAFVSRMVGGRLLTNIGVLGRVKSIKHLISRWERCFIKGQSLSKLVFN
ncbi:hypothetical protein [Pleionea sp. CnH1-48]|uniref:hypothetical protein n=1 Tax=Pleionea sp. CnH1-48 TaxID=2954494 RepID=UPI002097A593|nr:hypothetical protein [Pleionea sp. CnH1-48]MCO7225783.1 hypothetical protein [Pleionea sp. CnH1-48]